jgi:hypothetical protein
VKPVIKELQQFKFKRSILIGIGCKSPKINRLLRICLNNRHVLVNSMYMSMLYRHTFMHIKPLVC